MFRISVCTRIYLLLLCSVPSVFAEQSATSEGVVPPVVKFGGVLTDGNGKPLTGAVGVTFSLYKDSERIRRAVHRSGSKPKTSRPTRPATIQCERALLPSGRSRLR